MWLLIKSKVLSNVSWIALVILLIGMLTLKECQLVKAKRKASDMQSLYKAEVNKAEHFKKNEKNYSRVVSATINARNVKYIENEEINALKNEVGSLKKNLISYSKTSILSQGSFRTALKDTTLINKLASKPLNSGKNDSSSHINNLVYRKQFKYHDKYLRLDGIISGDSIMVQYNLRSPFEMYYYYKRPGKGFFKNFRKKIVYAEIKFENPNSSADKLYSLILTRDKSILRKL